MKKELLINATVVQRAVDFVDRHRGYTEENSEVRIAAVYDTTESQ